MLRHPLPVLTRTNLTRSSWPSGATKVRNGRLHLPGVVESWHHRVGDIGATELAVTAEHALLAGSMAWHHSDPFDRTLVSQAIIEGATFVTVDREIVGLPAPRVLTW